MLLVGIQFIFGGHLFSWRHGVEQAPNETYTCRAEHTDVLTYVVNETDQQGKVLMTYLLLTWPRLWIIN